MEHDQQQPGPDRVGGGGRFPATRATVLQDLRSADTDVRRRAFDALVAAYWRPVYKHVRLKWHAADEDARDLTQAFFSRAFEKGFFDRFDARQAKFRTFLRTCLDGFVANERKAIARLKRGGGVQVLSLDFDEAAGEFRLQDIPDPVVVDDYFDREWVRGIFTHAVDALREDCTGRGRDVQFALFRRYDIEPAEGEPRPTYGELAKEFGLSVNDVTNHLTYCRREFRRLVLDHLRRMCASDEEFRAEARTLLGVDPA
jgi:RNA polymerase sigma factor (sigma-70 family)